MHPEVELLSEAAKAPVNDGQLDGGGTQTVRLASVLDEIEALIRQHIQLPAEALTILIAVWIAGTYAYQRFDYFGYLALRSATPRCGKTKLLRSLAMLVKGQPPITTQPSAAVLFRTNRDVLLLDEVDKLRNSDRDTYGEVIAVLNAGFEKGAIVERVSKTKGDGFEVKAFPVFSPKALAGIESLADTLADRAFQIQMRRTSHKMPRMNPRRLKAQAQRIRDSLETWAGQHSEEIEAAYDNLPDELPALAAFDDRFQDIAEPLVVLASLADAERPEAPSEQANGQKVPTVFGRLMDGLKAAAGRREPSRRERELLAFLDMIEAKLIGTTGMFIGSEDLVQACQKHEGLIGIDTTTKLAGFLKHFELYPKSNGKQRGYSLTTTWIEEWRSRYRGTGDAK